MVGSKRPSTRGLQAGLQIFTVCWSRVSGRLASSRLAQQMSRSRVHRDRPNPIGLVITTTRFVVTLLLHFTGTHGLADCEALVATGWAPSAGWIVNTANPSWCCANQNGITCNVNATRVEQLTLKDLGLQGTGIIKSSNLILFCVLLHSML